MGLLRRHATLLVVCGLQALLQVTAFVATQQASVLSNSQEFIRFRKLHHLNSKDPKSDNDEINSNGGTGGFLSSLFNPYNSQIPSELRDEIYAAEARTPAAQDRSQRIAIYAVVALTGVTSAFFHVLLSELRQDGGANALQEAGFGWVEQSNALIRFFLLNKIGGGLLLLTGAGAGLLAEAEYDTQRINAEKIFAELQRRRQTKDAAGASQTRPNKKKKRRSGKESKRLNALAEIVDTKPDQEVSTTTIEENAKEPGQYKEKDRSWMDKIKGFYERADSMAASQALLLNKKLEDEGLLEKITDETGLKVVGKKEDTLMKQEQQENEEDKRT